MTTSLFIRFQATDFDAWLNPDADGLAQYLKEKGVLAYSIHRNSDDPNAIMIYHQFANEDTAKSFTDWFEDVTTARGNDQPETKIENVAVWVGVDLDGYCRTLA